MDIYYSLPDVSNSDLSWLKQQLHPRDMPDPTNAYRFGSLIDAMITEPERVNYFNRTLDDIQFSVDEFRLAEDMKRAFWKDDFCRLIAEKADGQKVLRLKEKPSILRAFLLISILDVSGIYGVKIGDGAVI